MQVGFMQGTKLALVHTQPRARHYLAEAQEADPVSDIVRRAHAILYVNLLRLIEIANTVTEMFAYYQLRSGFRQGASV